jgi:hypothetical protein
MLLSDATIRSLSATRRRIGWHRVLDNRSGALVDS